MNAIQVLRRGAASVCLTLLLASCAGTAVRTETVVVEKPVIVSVPADLTRIPPEPTLPAGPLTNEDIVQHVDDLRAWGRSMAEQLRQVAGLGKEGGDEPRPE